jgi:hypothetical protein
MMAFGGVELLMLMMLSGGSVAPDLVSMIDAKSYFQARQIKATPEKLAELATKDPADGKTQLAQLLALRQLAEDAADVKKAKDFAAILKQIEEVADGRKAQDPQGFAAEYAQRTLAALRGGKPVSPPGRGLPENSARQDALTWFPDGVKLVAALDLRSDTPPAGDPAKALRQLYTQLFPEPAREEVFKVVEKIGNVRVDRFAIAYTPDAKGQGNGRIYMRFTGKGDGKRLVALIKELSPQMVVKEQKGFRGQKVTLMSEPNHPPGFALIGDTDCIIAGFEGHGPKAQGQNQNQLEVVEEMLAVRSGKVKSVMTGPLGDSLTKFSPYASGVAVGELPEEMRRELTRGPQAFSVFPKTVFAEMLRKKDRLYLHWKTSLDNAEDAKRFVDDVARLKQVGIDGLKQAQQNLPPGLPLPPKTFEHATKLLQSIKTEAKGSAVSGSITIPADALNILGAGVGAWGFADSPAPPAKIEIKEKIDIKKIEKEAPPPPKGSSLRGPGRPLAWGRPAELTPARPAIAFLHEQRWGA